MTGSDAEDRAVCRVKAVNFARSVPYEIVVCQCPGCDGIAPWSWNSFERVENQSLDPQP